MQHTSPRHRLCQSTPEHHRESCRAYHSEAEVCNLTDSSSLGQQLIHTAKVFFESNSDSSTHVELFAY
ncbi:hypothetical protein FOCC_FOCC005336 [Frankliniella occidentalis]|nr:hypothetical protein FOCC_FOCC005336 [Frankliniella occidentalis]